MKYMASIFSLIFLLTALISIFLGLYIVKLNPKSNINKAFLFLCISLSLWSLGFSFANSAESLNESILWRRFAALGWTSIVSITLHFLILITRKEEKRKKDKLLYLLHIPALINMYIFSFSSKISKAQYNLVENKYGWANMTVNNGWDYFYYVYYAIYMLLGLFVLLEWKKRLKNKDKIRQVRLIFGSLFAAIVLGSITDITLSAYLKDPLPQMAPIFILFPTWSMYYSARYFDVINHKSLYEKEIIATEEDRKKYFIILL